MGTFKIGHFVVNASMLQQFKDTLASLGRFPRYIGHPPRSFAAKFVEDPLILAQLPTKGMTRKEVMEFCANPDHSEEQCFLVVMAWGKQKERHALSAWCERARFLPLLRDLRTGVISNRAVIYERFRLLAIPGLGPAYFTKLMFFMCHTLCLITDQWIGKSANVLSVTPLAHFYGDWFTRKNTGEGYDTLCSFITALAAHLNAQPGDVEEALFAGRGQPWRVLVKREFARHKTAGV